MKLRMKPRTRRWTQSFFLRGAVITAVFGAVVNVGYLAAQAVKQDPNHLVNNAVAGNLAAFMAWRDSSLIPAFGIAIAAFALIALGHFFTFGPKDYTPKDQADLIPWFTLFERIVHAVVLVAFVILAVTGLIVTYGRYVGGGGLTLALRQLHEMAGFLYIPSAILMILMWIKDALPAAYDVQWFMKAGGYLGYKGELKSGRFNAGQKVWFWIVAVTAVLHIWTGLALFFQSGFAPMPGGAWASNGPFTTNVYEQTNALAYLRTYTMLHLISTVPVVLMFVVHAYMTTLGAKGAIGAMINGKFSRMAAKKFHSEAPQLRSPTAAPAGSDD